jgi:hypothetical protein
LANEMSEKETEYQTEDLQNDGRSELRTDHDVIHLDTHQAADLIIKTSPRLQELKMTLSSINDEIDYAKEELEKKRMERNQIFLSCAEDLVNLGVPEQFICQAIWKFLGDDKREIVGRVLPPKYKDQYNRNSAILGNERKKERLRKKRRRARRR